MDSTIHKNALAQIISANELVKINKNDAYRIELLNIIKSINEVLVMANDTGQSECTIQLPNAFTFSQMNNNDCQLLVYTDLIVLLRERGYQLNILRQGNVYKLHLRWSRALSERERLERLEILKTYLIDNGGGISKK